jgi:succinate dehydrogenase flavin-adding protein (antitoxin of CptAB toxin-antitoxin module)
MWAQQNIAKLDKGLLRDFEVLLDEENPDLFKWLTGQRTPPEALAANRVFQVSRR